MKPSRLVAWVAVVQGFRPGRSFREQWVCVFDGAGNSVAGEPGESVTTVQIRYVDTVGRPRAWRKLSLPVSCVGLADACRIAEAQLHAHA